MGDKDVGRKKEISIVAEDQNWRSYVHNELTSAKNWQKDWGFLAEHSDENCKHINFIGMDRAVSTEEMIKKLENDLKTMNEKKSSRLKTSMACIGKGEDLESFKMKHLNKRK